MRRLLLILLSLTASAGTFAADDDALTGQADGSKQRPALPTVSLDKLANDERWKNHQPIGRDEFRTLQKAWFEHTARPDFSLKSAHYEARFSGVVLTDGRMTLEVADTLSPLALGPTNLSAISLSSADQPVELAFRPSQGLISLRPPSLTTVNGTWSATGRRRERSVQFQLSLPPATVTSLTLRTAADILVRSPNSLVRKLTDPKEDETKTDDEITWKILPTAPQRVTLNFSWPTDTMMRRHSSAEVTGDITIDAGQMAAEWRILLAGLTPPETLAVRMSRPCQVVSAEVNGKDVPFKQTKQTLSLDLSSLENVPEIFIRATENWNGRELAIPFLKPQFAQSQKSRDVILLESATTRVAVSQEFGLTGLQLSGLKEQLVTRTEDYHISELRHFESSPTATFELAPAISLTGDMVYTQAESGGSGGKATSYVQLSVRAGAVDRMQWKIPPGWRVTDVREADSGAPLLFRIDQLSVLSTFLRTPLSADESQLLKVTLRATGEASLGRREPPGLFPMNDHRVHDYIHFADPNDERIDRRWLADSVSGEELLALMPGLPADVLPTTAAYSRAKLRNVAPDEELPIAITEPTAEATDAPKTVAVASPKSSNTQIVTGQAFLMLRPATPGLLVDEILRCRIRNSLQPAELIIQVAEGTELKLLVNGRPVFLDARESRHVIPLPENTPEALIDILASADCDANCRLPLVHLPSADSVKITTVLSAPEELLVSSETQLFPLDAAAAGRLISNAKDTDRSIVDFQAAWQTNAAANGRAWTVRTPGRISLIINTHNASWNPLRWIIASLATVCIWQFTRLYRPHLAAAIVLLLVAFRHFFLVAWSPELVGIILGTIAFATGRTFLKWLGPEAAKNERQTSSIIRPVSATTLLTLLLLSEAASAQTTPRAVQPLASGGELPLVYVDSDFLQELNALAESNRGEPAVLDANLSLTMDSLESVTGVATIVVGTKPGVNNELVLPLEGVTLTRCSCNNAPAFPRRTPDGLTVLDIGTTEEPADTALVIPNVASDGLRGNDVADAVAASGPSYFEGWTMHVVEYEFRMPVRASRNELHLSLPTPQSPKATIRLTDSTNLLTAMETADQRGKREGDIITLTLQGSTRQAELTLTPRIPLMPMNLTDQVATIDVRIKVEPSRTDLNIDFVVRPSEETQTSVFVGLLPGQTVSVEAADGADLPWKLLGNELEVSVPIDDNGEQKFRLKQSFPSELSLQQKVNVAPYLNVNGQQANEVTLWPRIVDPFDLEAVSADQKRLTRRIELAPEAGRNSEASYLLPPETQEIQFDLAQRAVKQDVQLSQQAIVKDDRIEWSCRCESEITGSPIFRRVLLVSPNVVIENVTAESDGSTRIQEWTRTDNAVIVWLREATRGNLKVQLEGFVRRSPGTDAALPTVRLPDPLFPTSSSLDLSAETTSQSFIADLAGAQPGGRFDADEPLTATPLNLVMIDDQAPLVIRGTPQQQITADLTSFIYLESGQTRVAHVLACEFADPGAPVKFQIQNVGPPMAQRANSRVPIEQEEGIFVLPAADPASNATSLIIVPSQRPSIRTNRLTATVPDFESPLTIRKTTCFDLREGIQSATPERRRPISSSMQAILQQTLELDAPNSAVVQPARWDEANRQLLIQSFSRTTPSVDVQLPPGVVYVDCEHLLLPQEKFTTGSSSLLAFATQPQSELQLAIPKALTLTSVRMNGRPVALSPADGLATLVLPEALTQITIDWSTAHRESWRSFDAMIPLIEAVDSQQEKRVCVMKSPQMPSGWNLNATTTGKNDFETMRISSLTSGVQFASMKTDAAEPTTTRTLPADLAAALTNSSPTAVEQLESFLQRNLTDWSIRPGDAIYLQQVDSAVQYSSSRRPSFFSVFAVVASLAIVVGPLWERRRIVRVLRASEGSTIIQPRSSISARSASPLRDESKTEAANLDSQ